MATRRRVKPLTTKEALAILFAESDDSEPDDIVDAVYIPPDVDSVTDEEDVDDNAIAEQPLEKDISGTFELHTKTDIVNEKLTEECKNDESKDLQIPQEKKRKIMNNKSRKTTEGSKKQKKTIILPKWGKNTHPTYSTSPSSDEKEQTEMLIQKLDGKSPIEIFEMFMDEEILSEIVAFSKKYADDNNRHDFQFSVTDLKRFLGILILSGYHTLPQLDMYWSLDEDKGVPIIRKTMSRNRFKSIKQNIHLSDNSCLDKTDKFAKLRPFFTYINQKYLQFGIFSQHLSIDEEMVPYFGRHSAKMFIKGKPVRFGFKLWCLCSSDGYLFQFIPYGGAETGSDLPKMPLGTSVVLKLLSVVPKPEMHKIYFDNFFSSYDLLKNLKEKGFFATGTARENRISGCILDDTKNMKKKTRGSYDFAFNKDAETCAIKWNDNAVVMIVTNNGTILPLVNAKRYSRKERKEVVISQPNVISDYNKHMGGVDLHDNAIANYRIKILGKKWWWPLFTNVIDSVIANSWKLYRISNDPKMSLIDFRSYIVISLLKSECNQSGGNPSQITHPNKGRPSSAALPKEIRTDRIGHTISEHENKARRRCRLCKNHTIYLCLKCQIHLHPKCFEEYHKTM